MCKLTEDNIETNLIDLLSSQGYKYSHAMDLERSLDNVILESELKIALKNLNPDLPESARIEAFRHILHLGSDDIMNNNEKFHLMLTDGITVEYFKNGETVGLQVKLIDFENPENNDFLAVRQLVIKESSPLGERGAKRFDVVLFVNGLPLVVIELKSAISAKATLERAYNQIQTYKDSVPSIFYYNALCIISDGIDARVSSVTAPFSRFASWKSPDKLENGVMPELEIMTNRMLNKKVLLNLIRFNTVFESEEIKNEKTGLLSIIKIKKVAAYHQYYLVEKAVESTIRATKESASIAEEPADYGLPSVKTQLDGDKRIGVAWHTQGSGKSLSMLFYTGQLVVHPEMKNPTIVVLTDRNDLDDQLFETFSNAESLLRQTPVQAENRDNLKDLLKVTGGGIVFTTIQKFYPENDSTSFDKLSDRSNIVVIADEAHRSQYGFTGKIDKDGNLKYGNAKYMRDALPNASFIGFTGTPIEKEDRDTQTVFGNYIDVYDIAQAVKDGATVPLSYESRLVKIKFNDDVSDKIDGLIDEISGASKEQLETAKKKNSQINAIVGHPERLNDVASDIVNHFEARQTVFEGKGMIVCMTRQIAVDLYSQIIDLKPDWHNDDLDKGTIKVVMTSSSDDPKSFQPHHTNKKDRKLLATRLKDSNDELKLVIVQSMWLTGFDAPPLHTIYLDKKM